MPQEKPTAAAAKTPPSSWREFYPPHPCADVFPMMSDDELEALAQDIKEHGLQHPVLLIRIGKKKQKHLVLDGRNRLEALARLGVAFDADPYWVDAPPRSASAVVFEIVDKTDPATFVISANIRRRHLTKEQQAELIVKTIEAGQVTNDRATVARSFSPSAGKKGGSTKDPVLQQAVTEAAKHGISKRTVQHARATLQGKPKTPRPPRTQKLPIIDEPKVTPTRTAAVNTATPAPARGIGAGISAAVQAFAAQHRAEQAAAMHTDATVAAGGVITTAQASAPTHQHSEDVRIVLGDAVKSFVIDTTNVLKAIQTNCYTDTDRQTIVASLKDARDRVGKLYDVLDDALTDLARKAKTA